MLSPIITPHALLDCLVSSEVYGMCRACPITQLLPTSAERDKRHIPAPTMTLEIPRHSDAAPSIFVIVETALVRLVYIPPGEGFMT